jgi:hypothetical protein
MTKHKWHKEIKAWADGAEIEWRYFDTDSWMPYCNNYPVWHNNEYEFRIKPQPKEPQYLYVYRNKSTGEKEFRDIYTFVDTIPNALFIYLGKIKLEVDDATDI